MTKKWGQLVFLSLLGQQGGESLFSWAFQLSCSSLVSRRPLHGIVRSQCWFRRGWCSSCHDDGGFLHPTLRRRYLHGNALKATRKSDQDSSPQANEKQFPQFRTRLVNATLEHLDLLQAWDEQPHVQAASGENEDDDDWDWRFELPRQLSWRWQWIAYTTDREENVPIGIIQVIDPIQEESHYWGDYALEKEEDIVPHPHPQHRALDVWIGEATYLGQGYGTDMMIQALGRCFDQHQHVVACWIDPLLSNERACRFYQEKLGFEPVGVHVFDQDTCLVHRLNRSDWLASPQHWRYRHYYSNAKESVEE